MRLWSIHPKYLDCKGLVALWREALLAKKVLEGRTKKYKNHPQLDRFKHMPISFINSYLLFIWKEAEKRYYKFDKRKIGKALTNRKIEVTEDQLFYEMEHLKRKLMKRDNKQYKALLKIKKPEPNPLFSVRKGPVESWEKLV